MTESEWLKCDDPQQMFAVVRLGRILGSQFHVSDRKLRLWACACVRQVWEQVTDEWSQRAVAIAERHVDVLDDPGRMVQMHRQAFRVPGSEVPGLLMTAAECCNPDAVRAGQQACQLSTCEDVVKASLLREIVGNPWRPVALPYRCQKCDIPCGPPVTGCYCVKCGCADAICPWLIHAEGRVPKLARAIHDGRQWGEMPILADALEEAGCDNEGILLHLRRPLACVWCKGTRKISAPMMKGGPEHGSAIKHVIQPSVATDIEVGCPHCQNDGCGPHVRGCWVLDLLLGKS